MPVVSGKVKWACVQQPNTKFDPQWSIDVVLDIDTAKKLRSEGYNIRKDKDGDLILKCSKKTAKKDHTPNVPPRVVDGNKEPFKELIGNGSVCNVQYNEFPWEFAGNSGKKAQLVAVQVVELVPFSNDEFDVVGDTKGGAPSQANNPVDSDPDDFDDDIPF